MKAVWLENRELEVREIPVPLPAADEVLIRLRLAGICGTDLELVRGYYPFTGVPGHEFVGEVARAEAEPGLVGERVVGSINATCRECETCLAGRPSHCPNRTVLGIAGRGGVFCEYFTLPVRNLHRVPASVPDEAAVFTEPLAAACRIPEQVSLEKHERVLLLGAGRLGQLVARVLRSTGVDLTVAVKYPAQKELLERHGIAATDGSGVADSSMDLVVEATGSPAGFEEAVRAVRPLGTIVCKSTYHGDLTTDFSRLVVDEITLVGSRCGPFDSALDLLEGSLPSPADLISARFDLTEGREAFQEAARPGALKVLFSTK